MDKRAEFIVFLEPVREGMPDHPTPEEAEAVSAHFDYYKGLLDARSLILAGRTLDAPHAGVMIFSAPSLAEALRIAHEDPGVKAGVFEIRVQPYRVALMCDPACNSRSLGASLFNRSWDLLGNPNRTPEETDEMIHSVHASALHWLKAGGPTQAAHAHWMCARVWSALGHAQTALHHAARCEALCDEHDLTPFDRACADEAMARSLVCAGRGVEARAALDRVRATHDASDDRDVREVLERDINELSARLDAAHA